MAKRALCLIFAFLLSINSFAAIVSDNDGSAFVTKAEFEAMKKDFNEQVDNYNTSLDSKIDGAIAAYLAGMRLDKVTNASTICYTSDGILAPRASLADLDWKEGTMKVDIQNTGYFNSTSVKTDTTRGCGFSDVRCDGKEATEFYELGIQNLDYTNCFAEWAGRWKTKQYAHCQGWDIIWSADLPTGAEQYVCLWNGTYAISNTKLSGAGSMANWAYSNNTTDASKGLFPNGTTSNFTREKISSTHTSIICTPASAGCTRFNDFDNFMDWCNDTTNSSGHTVMTKASELWSSGTSKKQISVTNGTRKMTYYYTELDFDSNTQKRQTQNYKYYKPYFGFCTLVTNYNQLWTSAYDSYVDSLIESDSTTEYYTDKDNTKHLWLAAGVPLVEAKVTNKITITCEFADESDHDVWFKIGAFKKGVEANNDAVIDPKDIYEGGISSKKTATVGSQSKSVKVKSGEKAKFTFEMPKKGFVFCKWSLSGNSGAGGGTFLPPKTIVITAAD